MYLSYSGFTTYGKCPRNYWHRYIVKTVAPTPENRVNMLYGAIVGKLFEDFYSERMWNLPDFTATLVARVPTVAAKIMEYETKSGVIEWADAKDKNHYRSLDELLADVVATVPRGIASIKKHRLVGPRIGAEVKLDSTVGDHYFGGRADFIMDRVPPHKDTVIIDGKGSKWRHEYADVRQLYWYALLFEQREQRLPDQVGFLFWRYEPEESIDWHPVTRTEVDKLRIDVLQVIDSIEGAKKLLPTLDPKEAFPAHPGRDCARCGYVSACAEGTAVTTKRSMPKLSNEAGVEDVDL